MQRAIYNKEAIIQDAYDVLFQYRISFSQSWNNPDVDHMLSQWSSNLARDAYNEKVADNDAHRLLNVHSRLIGLRNMLSGADAKGASKERFEKKIRKADAAIKLYDKGRIGTILEKRRQKKFDKSLPPSLQPGPRY